MAIVNPPYANALKRVPPRIIAITAAMSATLLGGALVQEYPLYVVMVMGLLPWIPAFILETIWTYKHYHWLAIFGTISILQVGHLGEHSTQLVQLLMTDGALAESRGVFGQLDFEAVHFFWDTGVWIGSLLLLWRYGRGSPWLWVSLFFASAHEVEHMYLYYVYLFEFDFYYEGGGFAGVLGKGGVVPTVERPYLHFGYNFMVVIPLVIAFFKQLGSVYDEYLPRRYRVSRANGW